jgi:hypothetical protein
LNKKKLLNDPVYGFVHVPTELVFDLIEHPLFQRLRRIKQLGLTDFVYPGALHTRFHHALGAMHLMGIALQTLLQKGVEITEEEYEAACIAALLHDLGHGPYSHALEGKLIEGVHHESITLHYLHLLEQDFGKPIALARSIFEKNYSKPFLSQLVSGQLDVDRLDYLNRDCFFTGVTEGSIGVENILRMLQVVDGQLLVEEKGIYSLESFLHARRIMYWQVYMHKTGVAAEQMLISALERAKETIEDGCSDSLRIAPFLKHSSKEVSNDMLERFTQLDDSDILQAIKFWATVRDPVLQKLAISLLNRRLFKCVLSTHPPNEADLQELADRLGKEEKLPEPQLKYFIRTGEKSNAGYVATSDQIRILTKQGEIREISEASDLPNIKALGRVVKKYYLCHPKALSL